MTKTERIETTEEAVFSTAIRLMAERGYHGTSLRDVARSMDMQMSSLYHYFRSKQALLTSIMRESLERLQSEVTAALEGRSDPVDCLRAGLDAHIRYHIENPDAAIVTDSEMRSLEADERLEIVALRDEYEGIFVQILREGTSRGDFSTSEPGIAATALLVAAGSVSVWYDPSGRLTPTEVTRVLVDLFLSGVCQG